MKAFGSTGKRIRFQRSSQKSDQGSLDLWISAANEGTTLLQILYTAFLLVLVVCGSTVYSTTHKQLFLDEFIGVQIGQALRLPTSAFFFFFPLVVVFLHFQLLWQMLHVSRRVRRLLSIMEDGQTDDVQLRLTNLVIVQALVGRGATNLVASWLLFGSVVVAPLLLLCYAQLVFLPFHSELITTIYRLLIVVDSILVLALWPHILSSGFLEWASKTTATIFGKRRTQNHNVLGHSLAVVRGHTTQMFGAIAACTVGIFFSFFVLIFPGEHWERAVVRIADRVVPAFVVKPNSPQTHVWWLGLECHVPNVTIPHWATLTLGESSPPNGCDVPYPTLITTATWFASDGLSHRSLRLRGEILSGESLSGPDVLKLRGGKSGSALDPDFEEIVSRVVPRLVGRRNLDFAVFDRARLVAIDLSDASIVGASFRDADLHKGTLNFRNGAYWPYFGGANLAAGNLQFASSATGAIHLVAPLATLNLKIGAAAMDEIPWMTLDAPFATISLNIGPASGEKTCLTIGGNLSFSSVRLSGCEGGKVLFENTKLTGSQVEVRAHTNLKFGTSRQEVDFKFGSLRISSEKSTVELELVDFQLGEIRTMNPALLTATSVNMLHAVVWPLPEDNEEKKLHWLQRLPKLPVGGARLDNFLFRHDRTWYDKEMPAIGAWGIMDFPTQQPALWCSASAGRQVYCLDNDLNVDAVNEIANITCSTMFSDGDFLIALERKIEPSSSRSVAMNTLDIHTKRSTRSLFSRYINELTTCVERQPNVAVRERVKKVISTWYSKL